MKLKNILILILCIVLCPPIVMAVSDNTVYTEFTGGNSSSTGNGTEQSPYNLFEDALNAVEDGGTICVGEKGAFVNSSDDKPLVINKNVTITSKSDTAPEISIRKAGVVLGGNVSFKNVVLSLVNGNHALIAANGYTLTLDNVTYFQNTREVHIVGGTLYDKNGVSLSPTVGEKSKIVLSGNKTHFGNIYAGSINGSFDKDVEIDINGGAVLVRRNRHAVCHNRMRMERRPFRRRIKPTVQGIQFHGALSCADEATAGQRALIRVFQNRNIRINPCKRRQCSAFERPQNRVITSARIQRLRSICPQAAHNDAVERHRNINQILAARCDRCRSDAFGRAERISIGIHQKQIG